MCFHFVFTAMQAASKTLFECMSEVYEPDWTGHDLLTVQSQNVEMLWQDLAHKLTDQVLIPLNTYQGQFPEMRVTLRWNVCGSSRYLTLCLAFRKKSKSVAGSWWITMVNATRSRHCKLPRNGKRSKSPAPRSSWKKLKGLLPFSTLNSTRSCQPCTNLAFSSPSPICRRFSLPSKSSTLNCPK